MRHALSLLESTNLPVSETSYHVGYDNVVNYNRIFKKTFSETPTDYRKNKNMSKNK